MDPISNSELVPPASQSHLASANYINGRDLLTHFANLSSHERPKSKSPSIPGSGSNNGNNTTPSTTSADIYSAILNSQQQQQAQQTPLVMDESTVAAAAAAAAAAANFSSPIRHLSEPSNAPNRHSPMGK